MLPAASYEKSGENAWLWLAKIVTGLLIVVVLGIHLVVNHFAGKTGLLTYADVVAYYANPLIPLMEIAFLVLVVSHALIGVRSVILDLQPSRRALAAVNWVLTGIGIVAVVYGIWLVQAITSRL